MSEEDLSKKVSEYQKVAKEVPGVDVGLLMMNALANEKQNEVSAKAKRWAYLVSIGVPPFGLFFALKYYFFSDEEDAKTVALVCVILTFVSILLIWAGGALIFSSSGTSVQQLQQIKPSDIQQLTQ